MYTVVAFSSSSAAVDPQCDSIKKEVSAMGAECIVINPHDLNSLHLSLRQIGGKIALNLSDRELTPEVFYFVRHWRTDCVVRTPTTSPYPGAFRSRIEQFLQDVRFAFERAVWVPGGITAIQRAESKPAMLAIASELGISVPGFTYDAFFKDLPDLDGVYRKNLGFPFTLSLNRQKGVEVGVTATNSILHVDHSDFDSAHPWQWQEFIDASVQVRCFVHGNNVWSASWTRDETSAGVDYRLVNQIERRGISWVPYSLPPEVRAQLVRLVSRLGLISASPEFLVRKQDGEHILIDLNPCGDWLGYFDDSENAQIARHIAEHLLQCAKISKAQSLLSSQSVNS